MACIDPRTDAIVIRIVYDGAPLAGKTTSVRALGERLGAGVVTPAEVEGRTGATTRTVAGSSPPGVVAPVGGLATSLTARPPPAHGSPEVAAYFSEE